MGFSTPQAQKSFRNSPAKLAKHQSTPAPSFWDKARSKGFALFSFLILVIICWRLYHLSGDVLPALMNLTREQKAVASFRFDDDFDSLTEEKKLAYLDEIARVLGVDSVDLKSIRKGSVIVDINVDKDTAERLQRDSQKIGSILDAEVSVDGDQQHSRYFPHGFSPFGDARRGSKVGTVLYADPDNHAADEIILQSGDHVETDRGLFALAKVSGMLFHDRNANGILDFGTEEGIEGIQVNFVRADDGEVIAEMFTDRNGQYHFSEKEPGDYFVSIQLTTGHRLSPLPNAAVLSDYQARATATRTRVIKSDFEPTRGGNSTNFALNSGSSTTELNGALYIPAQIHGFAWEDIRGEGVFRGVAHIAQSGGVEYSLGSHAMADLILQTDPELPIVASVPLVANGAFIFDHVMPGTYQLKFSLPPEHYFVRSSLEQPVFMILSGERRDTNMGFYKTIKVTGSIFEDLNALGYITGKETEARRHIRGAHIELIAETPETRESNRYLMEHRAPITSAVIPTSTGLFEFEGFAPGLYHLRFIPPAGYKLSKRLSQVELERIRTEDPEAMASDANPQNGLTDSYLITSGSHFHKPDGSEITVCMYTLATLGGYIWEDKNADGIFDDDERALPNVEVHLSNYDGTFQRSTFTNERGHYIFKNLEPGRYRRPVIVPPSNHQLSNARITFKYVDANDRRLQD